MALCRGCEGGSSCVLGEVECLSDAVYVAESPLKHMYKTVMMSEPTHLQEHS
jgi:hypothetical protein